MQQVIQYFEVDQRDVVRRVILLLRSLAAVIRPPIAEPYESCYDLAWDESTYSL